MLLSCHKATDAKIPLKLLFWPSARHQFYTARPRIRGQCIARCAYLRRSDEAGTKLYCLVTEAHVYEQLA